MKDVELNPYLLFLWYTYFQLNQTSNNS